MISRTATTRLVADILDLLDRDWIAWANVLELLAYASGLKPVVRLVADAASGEVLADFCRRQQWPWRWSGFWLESIFHTPLNDTFTRLVYGHAPADCDRALFVGREAATRRAEELEGMSDPTAARELAALYGYPECCVAAYAEVQSGKPWLEVFLRGSDPADRVRDWRVNKAAYLFPPHPTLLPEYFPCSVDCAPTARLAWTYEAVLQEYGLRALVDIIREGLMRPLLLFGGSLYRFDGLESRGGWHHVIGSTEQYRIDDPAEQRQPSIGRIEALHIGGGKLTVRNGTGEWHEPLAPGRTQLLRFG
jgi:hypothetical protein